MTKFIGIVASTSEQLKIGHEGNLPWHFPEDLAHFRKVTIDHTLIMGRKTFEGLPKPLEGRDVIVIGKGYHTLGEAVDKALTHDKVFIAGGKQVYDYFKPLISEWYWTLISERVYEYDHCDTKMDFFPCIERNDSRKVASFPQGTILHITNNGKYICYDK